MRIRAYEARDAAGVVHQLAHAAREPVEVVVEHPRPGFGKSRGAKSAWG